MREGKQSRGGRKKVGKGLVRPLRRRGEAGYSVLLTIAVDMVARLVMGVT